MRFGGDIKVQRCDFLVFLGGRSGWLAEQVGQDVSQLKLEAIRAALIPTSPRLPIVSNCVQLVFLVPLKTQGILPDHQAPLFWQQHSRRVPSKNSAPCTFRVTRHPRAVGNYRSLKLDSGSYGGV